LSRDVTLAMPVEMSVCSSIKYLLVEESGKWGFPNSDPDLRITPKQISGELSKGRALRQSVKGHYLEIHQ
jgi:hypothetical protein